MTLNKLKISYSSFSTFFKLSQTNCQSSTTALAVIYYPKPLAKITEQHDRAKTLSIMTLKIMNDTQHNETQDIDNQHKHIKTIVSKTAFCIAALSMVFRYAEHRNFLSLCWMSLC